MYTALNFSADRCRASWLGQIWGQLLKLFHSEKYVPSSLRWEERRESSDLWAFSEPWHQRSHLPRLGGTGASSSPFQFGSWEDGRALPRDPGPWPWGPGWIEEVEQGQIRDAHELWMASAELSTLAVQSISARRISLTNGRGGGRRRLLLVRYSQELMVNFWDVYTTFNMCTKSAATFHSLVSWQSITHTPNRLKRWFLALKSKTWWQ